MINKQVRPPRIFLKEYPISTLFSTNNNTLDIPSLSFLNPNRKAPESQINSAENFFYKLKSISLINCGLDSPNFDRTTVTVPSLKVKVSV